jgi:uncharacterized membrane-anchored protein YitT (DUF2179 family)
MFPLLQYMTVQSSRKHKKKPGQVKKEVFPLSVQKRRKKTSLMYSFKNCSLILIGIVSAIFGIRGFLVPNSLIDGGVTGLSLLIKELSGFHLSLLIIAFNVPFLWLGFHQINRNFTLRGIVAIAIFSLALEFLHFEPVTDDVLLSAVFGGFFLGLGIGFVIRGNSVIDGTEILAIYLDRRTPFSVGDIILGYNILLFSVAATLLSVETALYSIITYFAASRTVNFIIEGIEEYVDVTIISDQSEEVKSMIIKKLKKGVTIYNGRGGYGVRSEHNPKLDILYTVITRLEISKLHLEVEKIDPDAFMITRSVKDIRGGVIRKHAHKRIETKGDK